MAYYILSKVFQREVFMTKTDFINERKTLAGDYFSKGYNCAQSVALAFCDLTDLDENTILMLSSPFGGGMGQLREVCGAVSGMFLIKGLISGYASPTDKDIKKKVYTETKALAESFREENGDIICRNLLSGIPHSTNGTPEARTEEYYKKRPCKALVESAACILADYIFENLPNLISK